MKKYFIVFSLILVFITLMNISYSQIPRTISYQGILTDTLGNPKPDGSYNITFILYDAQNGGLTVWSATKAVNVKRGLFSAILGEAPNPFDPSVVKFDKPYWLGIRPEGEPEDLSPRIPLTAVGYSLNSVSADSARIAGTVPDNTITSTKITSGQVVKSVNTLTDDVILAPGSNISITPSGNTLTIAATGVGSGTVTNVGAGTPGAVTGTSGLTISPSPITTDGTISIATGGVTSAMIQDGAIATADIANNAVTATKIADEPGVAYFANDAAVTINDVYTNLTSRTITVPASGYVYVSACAQFNIPHTTGTYTQIDFGASNISASLPANQDFVHRINADAPTASYYFTTLSAHGIFQVSAGANTFYFVARRSAGAAAASPSINDVAFSVLFFPTSYGTVSPPLNSAEIPDGNIKNLNDDPSNNP